MTSRTGSHRHSWSRGLTLIEVLVSVVLLATAAVCVLQALAGISHAMTLSESRTTAYGFCLSKMAELELAAQRGDVPLEKPQQGSFRQGHQRFAWTASASPMEEYQPALQILELSVAWRDGAHDRDMRFATVVTTKPEPAAGATK